MTDPSSRSHDLLLVEDNPAEVRLLEEALDDANIGAGVHVVTDGDEALDFVFQRGSHADAPRPDLILLNWGLPGKSGEEVLAELKGTERIRRTPVIVLTGSNARRDRRRAYELQANAYVQKPTDPAGHLTLVRSLDEFWLQRATLPESNECARADM